MCYVISAEGRDALRAHGRPDLDAGSAPAMDGAQSRTTRTSERRLRQARRDVHVAGWALALASILGFARTTVRGPNEVVLSPPLRSYPDGRAALGPGDLRLPGGRTPHDFLRIDAGGSYVEVERFETVRPKAILEVHDGRGGPGSGESNEGVQASVSGDQAGGTIAGSRLAGIDVLLELDDGRPSARRTERLERYEHFLSGWSSHTGRYGRRLEAVPLLVFICSDRSRARDSARHSDPILRACRAYAGDYPFDWEYPARERILFVAERDVHERLLHGYGVPRLPPDVRVSAAHGDPRAGAALAEPRSLLDVPAQGDGLYSEP